MSVQVINPLEDSSWDTRVASHPSVSIFHTTAWARVIESSYGFEPTYLVSENDGVLVAALPLVGVTSWLNGRRGVALPFADFCPPIVRDPAQAAVLLESCRAIGREHRWSHVEIRGGRAWFPDAPAAPHFVAHELALAVSSDRLFTQLPAENRRAIHKAERIGLTTEFSTDLEAVRTFYRLHELTRRRHGVPPQPFSFFSNLHRHLLATGYGFVATTRHRGAALAAAVFLHTGRSAVYKFGASDPRQLDSRPNNYLMWKAIEHLQAGGFEVLHFGRTSPSNVGLRRFKLSWTAREFDLDYVRFDLNQSRFVPADESQHRIATAVFRCTPPQLNRLVGALLYKHLA